MLGTVWIRYIHPAAKTTVKRRVSNSYDEIYEFIDSKLDEGEYFIGTRLSIKGLGEFIIKNVTIDDEICFDCR